MSFGLPALKWLQAEARRLGCSVGDLIRRIVDEAREDGAQAVPGQLRKQRRFGLRSFLE